MFSTIVRCADHTETVADWTQELGEECLALGLSGCHVRDVHRVGGRS